MLIRNECESSGTGKGSAGLNGGAACSTQEKVGDEGVLRVRCACVWLCKCEPMRGMFLHHQEAQMSMGRVCTCELCGRYLYSIAVE